MGASSGAVQLSTGDRLSARGGWEKTIRSAERPTITVGLSVYEGKTRLIEFERFAAGSRPAAGQRRPETFRFLGFYALLVKRKTQAKRMVRKLKVIREMRQRMHAPVRGRHRWLSRALRGHYRYYGVIFNSRALRAFQTCVVKLWRKTLGKRSQKGRMTWPSYARLLTIFPLPAPVIHRLGTDDRPAPVLPEEPAAETPHKSQQWLRDKICSSGCMWGRDGNTAAYSAEGEGCAAAVAPGSAMCL
jgi:hypothetical protein